MNNYHIPTLPLGYDLETKEVLKQLNRANKKLAELKGVALTIPNENILISTLTLQEAKDSSEVENIVTATKMGTLSDAVVKENFLAVWFSRDVTQPDYDGNGNPLGKICRGIAPKLKISASVLWNASRHNRNVFAELIALGHRRPVSGNGHPVTCNGHIVTCRDSVLPQQNNNQNS